MTGPFITFKSPKIMGNKRTDKRMGGKYAKVDGILFFIKRSSNLVLVNLETLMNKTVKTFFAIIQIMIKKNSKKREYIIASSAMDVLLLSPNLLKIKVERSNFIIHILLFQKYCINFKYAFSIII